MINSAKIATGLAYAAMTVLAVSTGGLLLVALWVAFTPIS